MRWVGHVLRVPPRPVPERRTGRELVLRIGTRTVQCPYAISRYTCDYAIETNPAVHMNERELAIQHIGHKFQIRYLSCPCAAALTSPGNGRASSATIGDPTLPADHPAKLSVDGPRLQPRPRICPAITYDLGRTTGSRSGLYRALRQRQRHNAAAASRRSNHAASGSFVSPASFQNTHFKF